MNYKLLGVLLLVLMITASAFAAAPTLSDLNWSPKIVGDLNYSKWNDSDFISIFSTVTGADLNAEDCYWTVDNGDTWTRSEVDMNTDTNIITVSINMPSVTDDINAGLKCINTAAEESDPVYQRIWDDATAPVTTPNHPSGNPANVILTAVDSATTTGDGSGFQATYYWIDSGAVVTSTTNPTTFSISDVGSHTIYWCSIDNLDNNECTQTGIWSKTVTVTPAVSSGVTCTVINLFPLLLFALAFVGANGLMAYRKASQNEIKSMVVFIIGLIVGVLVLISIIPILC